MKVAFLALLLLNVAVLSWHLWQPPASGQGAQADKNVSSMPSLPPLKLVPKQKAKPPEEKTRVAVNRKEQREPQSAEEPARQSTRQSTEQAVCLTYGLFADKATAQSVLAGLSIGAGEAELVAEDVSVTDTYRVYFPSFPTLPDARAMVAKLHEAGVKDVYVITDGPLRNAVSVGVFRIHDGAIQRRQHLESLGFQPLIKVRSSHTEQRYRVRTHNAAAALALRKKAGNTDAGRTVETCASIAAVTGKQ